MIAASVRRGIHRPLGVFRALHAALLLVGWFLAVAAPAVADCGDAIGGQRVPCGCGDIVVADTRLQPGDPVVSEPCAADGLLLRAPMATASIVLDLNGQEIRGSGAGTGIRVIRGGSAGAEILGGVSGVPGTVAGFGEGIRSTRPADLRLIANLIVRESRGAGVVVRGNSASIESVRVEGNGADGLRVSGKYVDVRKVESEGNDGRGVRVRARNGELDVSSRSNRRVDFTRGRERE